MSRVINRVVPGRVITRSDVYVPPPPPEDPVDGTTPPPLETGAGFQTLATPANLRIEPMYDNAYGGGCCKLKWDHNGIGIVNFLLTKNTHETPIMTIPGNVSEVIVPANLVTGGVFAIQAVGDVHAEQSLRSNWVPLYPGENPSLAYPAAVATDIPTKLTVTPLWQPSVMDADGGTVAAHPVNALTWYGMCEYFDVERDGFTIATGIWCYWYMDHTATPGATHVYKIRERIFHRDNYYPSSTPSVSGWSASVSATTRTARYPFLSTKINIKGVYSTHDGMMIYFDPVAGALDYRAYVIGREGGYKYTGPYFDYSVPAGPGYSAIPSPLTEDNNGTGVSIYMAGIAAGEQIVIEAVDKSGPFNMQTGTAHRHAGWVFHTNGQMEPSGVPYSIAVSDPVTVVLNPVTPGTGEFFESFHNGEAPVVRPSSEIDPEFYSINGGMIQKAQMSTCDFYFSLCDRNNSQVFTTHNTHGMDLTFDGEDDDRATQHVANASFFIEPRHTFDLSGTKAVEISFLVSPFTGGRKWWEIQVMSATDQPFNPGKFAELQLQPSRERDILRWQIKDFQHFLHRFLPPTSGGQFDAYDIGAASFAEFYRGYYNQQWPTLKGTNREIDKPSLFKMTFSRLKVRIEEICLFNNTFTFSKTRTFAAGQELPYNTGKVIFVHQVYHTSEARNDAGRGSYLYSSYAPQYQSFGNFDVNCMPFNDEGHWDDIRIRPLASFPD